MGSTPSSTPSRRIESALRPSRSTIASAVETMSSRCNGIPPLARFFRGGSCGPGLRGTFCERFFLARVTFFAPLAASPLHDKKDNSQSRIKKIRQSLDKSILQRRIIFRQLFLHCRTCRENERSSSMRIVILNGEPDPASTFQAYLCTLTNRLSALGHAATKLDL